jgi:hypothetical protein
MIIIVSFLCFVTCYKKGIFALAGKKYCLLSRN